MNYFEYFTEIEDRFTARRGSLLLLSTLDWALIETWREAGVPLPAVLRGIDTAFDRYEARKSRGKGRVGKVNGLAWCAQAVMEAASETADARIGAHEDNETSTRETGFEEQRIASFLAANAQALRLAAEKTRGSLMEALTSGATRLLELSQAMSSGTGPAPDELDRTLTVMEERLQAALLTATPEEDLLRLREKADADVAGLRGLGAVQRRQVREQYVHKQIFASHKIPRLSLFYMPMTSESAGDAT